MILTVKFVCKICRFISTICKRLRKDGLKELLSSIDMKKGKAWPLSNYRVLCFFPGRLYRPSGVSG